MKALVNREDLIQQKVYDIYLRILAFVYCLGSILHLADLLDLRLEFSKMNLIWKLWIGFLFFADFFAFIGLWKKKNWGVFVFLFIALTQLVAYVGFSSIFNDQSFLIIFHLLAVFIYFLLLYFKTKFRAKI